MMIRKQLRQDIEKALEKLTVGDGDIEITRTNDAKFGDFSTNVALRLAEGKLKSGHTNKQSPLETANILADSLKDSPYVEKLEVAGPGFINFFIKDTIWREEVEKVLKEKEKYGSNSSGEGKKARVEYVSANPTGPLHFGNARGGPIGDSFANILEFSGWEAVREYYQNDIGNQVKKLGESIVNIRKGEKLEDQEYKGTYIEDLAREFGDLTAKEAGKKAVAKMLEGTLADCRDLGIKFDKIYQESEISSQFTQKTIAILSKKGVLKNQAGAVWFAPSDQFLKDRETVVIKSDSEYTYFASDIALHKLKFDGGGDLVVDVLGADHHGHVPRLQAAIKALGYDVSKFHVILYQWVRFKRGEEIIKTSKRSGSFITVREVIDEIGSDAVRFFILMHDANSHIDFDLDLAREKSSKNPVYYVQYAHARICSILVKSTKNKKQLTINHKLLTTKFELDLIKQISRLPELVEDISQSFAVHRLTSYATELADSFHKFYENCRVIGEDKQLMEARLALIWATKITLANTLRLLGVSAPRKM